MKEQNTQLPTENNVWEITKLIAETKENDTLVEDCIHRYMNTFVAHRAIIDSFYKSIVTKEQDNEEKI